ncbi:HIRAN domain-containing protein [Kyrpidia sp.]|uniref:HIRAN domain-containing protein n=1 Tax=Kyrpidia sp. TaxID=2073077 RepID=UPI002585E0FA|nr:HIRAN domain-containing protein [Kyrpidia sp.]
MEERVYIAVTGIQHYFGPQVFQLNQIIVLTKEPDNAHDAEAIRAEIPSIGKLGYVANSPHTVPRGCRSAGRIYDLFEQSIAGVVRFILKDTVIVELLPDVKEIVMIQKLLESKSNVIVVWEPTDPSCRKTLRHGMVDLDPLAEAPIARRNRRPLVGGEGHPTGKFRASFPAAGVRGCQIPASFPLVFGETGGTGRRSSRTAPKQAGTESPSTAAFRVFAVSKITGLG